jgi:2-dehydropantoate 2-reductase
MRICVFGAGALGSAIGGLLASQHEVSLVAKRAHAAAIRKEGLRIDGVLRRRVRVAAYEHVEDAPAADLLVICTKAFDTRSAIDACRKAVGESTRALTLQNGLGNLELLREWKGRKAFGGTTTLGARLVRPGVIQLAGLGETIIGGDMDVAGARKIAAAFTSAGIKSCVKKNIEREIWSKVVVSACINPLTAILRVPNGALLSSPVISRLASEVARECLLVSAAEGHALSTARTVARIRSVARSTAKNHSSMLQDIERGRRTEISMINGAVCALAAKRGIPVPLNSALVAVVEALERDLSSEKG